MESGPTKSSTGVNPEKPKSPARSGAGITIDAVTPVLPPSVPEEPQLREILSAALDQALADPDLPAPAGDVTIDDIGVTIGFSPVALGSEAGRAALVSELSGKIREAIAAKLPPPPLPPTAAPSPAPPAPTPH